jgi:hypothetical protein
VLKIVRSIPAREGLPGLPAAGNELLSHVAAQKEFTFYLKRK